MILAGDIGGTKTALALYDDSEETLCQIREATFQSVEYPALETILAEFLASQESLALQATCCGVAGPVVDGHSHATNLPWVMESPVLAEVLHLPVVKVKLLSMILRRQRLVYCIWSRMHSPSSIKACSARAQAIWR
jgi:glucokinase